MINLTVDGVLADLDALVSEFGEGYVYGYEEEASGGPACLYAKVKDGKPIPDCIAGHVLVRNGFPVEELIYGPAAGSFAVGAIDENLQRMKDEGLVTFESGVDTVLRVAQMNQDLGYTWGHSVAEAKAVQR